MGKSIEKGGIDPAPAVAVKIDPDVAVSFLFGTVIKPVKTVAVSGADDGGGVQMQKCFIKLEINRTGTDHFKRKSIRVEMAERMNIRAVKGTVIGVGDDQIIKIKNRIQKNLLKIHFCL